MSLTDEEKVIEILDDLIHEVYEFPRRVDVRQVQFSNSECIAVLSYSKSDNPFVVSVNMRFSDVFNLNLELVRKIAELEQIYSRNNDITLHDAGMITFGGDRLEL